MRPDLRDCIVHSITQQIEGLTQEIEGSRSEERVQGSQPSHWCSIFMLSNHALCLPYLTVNDSLNKV